MRVWEQRTDQLPDLRIRGTQTSSGGDEQEGLQGFRPGHQRDRHSSGYSAVASETQRKKRRGAFEIDERNGWRPFSKRQFRRECRLVVHKNRFPEPVETVSKAYFASPTPKSSNQETERHHVSRRRQSAEKKSFFIDKYRTRTATVRFGTKGTRRNLPYSSPEKSFHMA